MVSRDIEMARHIAIAPHPRLDLGAFVARFPAPLCQLNELSWVTGLLVLDAPAPLQRSEAVRGAVRDLLRHGGYKPTGRGKPASEFLLKAATLGQLLPINRAVDIGNAVSLHSGLPISVVALEGLVPPLCIAIADKEAAYAFNASGQVIQLDGLICLHDANGPCANGVKDAQRTKTGPDTRGVLCLVWGDRTLPGRTEQTTVWFREMMQRAEASIEEVSRSTQHQSFPW